MFTNCFFFSDRVHVISPRLHHQYFHEFSSSFLSCFTYFLFGFTIYIFMNCFLFWSLICDFPFASSSKFSRFFFFLVTFTQFLFCLIIKTFMIALTLFLAASHNICLASISRFFRNLFDLSLDWLFNTTFPFNWSFFILSGIALLDESLSNVYFSLALALKALSIFVFYLASCFMSKFLVLISW